MNCLEFGLRLFMFVLSGILVVAGAAGLGEGVWMKLSPSSIQGIQGQIGDEQLERFLSYLLMAAGPPLVLIGILGCCGAVKDSRRLWLLFFVTALTVIMAQVAGAVVVLGFPGELADLLGPKAVELIEENKNLPLSVIGAVTAMEAVAMASSMGLYCISKGRRIRPTYILPN